MFGSPSTPFGSSAFGSGTSAFGSTAGTTFGSSGFGTGGSIFGAKTTAATAFGTATPAQTGTGLFGSTATGSTGLFGTPANTFGSGANAQKTSGFGGFGTTGGLFGSSGTSGTSLFSGSTNAFGNANKSMFGTPTNTTGSMFGGTTTNTGTGLFGAKPAQPTGLFGASTTATTGGLFGSNATAGQNAAGTPVKFVPQTSTDTMMKNGIQSSISTKHQCITLMKEYDKKSLEELRMEDYQLGRKGPQAAGTGTTTGTGMFGSSFGTSTGGATFGTGGFGASTGTGLFGQPTQTPSIFSAKTTSGGLFGQSSTTFSAPSAFTNTSSSLFGPKPGGLFGPTTTTQSTGLFGTTPGFGAASSGGNMFGTPSFGQTTQQTGVFGATSQPGSSLFGKTAFGTTTTGTGLFGTSGFGQTAQSSLFGPKSTTGTLGTFGATNTGGLFGTQNKPASAFGGTFGTATGTTNLFGTTGTGLFGNPTGTVGFGTTGSTLGQPLGSTLGGTFGQTTLGGTGTSLLGLGQNNAVALQQQQQLQQQLQQQVLALTSSPFGDSPLFRNLTSRTKTDKPLAVTSQARQRGANTPSQYKVSPRPSARVKPRAIGKLNFSQARLFDGLDDDIEYSSETFVPRRSIKKLVLNSKSQARSISSELSNPSEREREDSPETSQVRPGSNSETPRDKFYSPKPNTSLGQDDSQDSPLVGIRRSNVPRDLGTDSPRMNATQSAVNGEASTTQSEPLSAVGNEDADGDDEQGPEPIEGETLEDEMQKNAGRRGCGVILDRSEYYCNPSIDELDDMVDENGDVIVGDFVVGREGFGMVKFFGECNVEGLNLDEIVSFRRREIEVYPDTYPDKPPVGDGLNRKSEVTLYKVWPNDKTTRTPIKNPDRLRKVGWLEKLENATARLGATFVDYQADTGTWIFTVDHFTRYGLKEVQIEMEDGSVGRPPLRSFHEDNEKVPEARLEKEKAAIAMKMRLEEDMENKKKLLQEKMYDESSLFLEAQDDSQMTDISQETIPEFCEPLDEEENAASPASHHLATAMGVKSQRMQVMKASFFGQSEEPRQHQYINNNDMRPREFRLGNNSVLNSTGFDDGKAIHERPIYSPMKTKSMTIYPESQSRGDTRIAKERRTEYENYRNKPQWYSLPQPILLPSVVGSPSETALKAAGIRTQPALVPLSQSVTAGKHYLFADAGLTMGRSFRVGWGPAWRLVYSSRVISVSPNSSDQRLGREVVRGSPLVASSVNNRQSSSFAISCARVNVSPTMKWNSEVSQTQLIERLEVCLANVSRNEDDSSPYFSPTEGVTALHQYSEVACKTKEMLASGAFKESADVFSSVMDLAVALWGNLSMLSKDSMDTDTEDVLIHGYDEAFARKEALSEWLAKTSQNVINEEIENVKAQDNDHLRIIFSLLTGKQINVACRVAQSNGDSRLSLLLAQSSGNMIVRQWLLKQLDDWLEHKVDKFITADRLKIYALLAGELAWRGIEVCQDLDWKRSFALHLWYQRSTSGLVTDAMTSYENSFKGRTSTGIYAAEPSPSYLASTQENRADGHSEKETQACRDTCYHLIKLFCKRSHRLEHTLAPASYTKYQLDVSLSWHLYQILRSVGYNHLSEYYASYLTTSYAGQLEAMGLWHWAIFVLMHIQDTQRREQAVQKVLVRYCILDDDPSYDEKETFLLNDLGVPVAWIHEAKVIRARRENRPKDEAYHLLKSGNFNLSHEVILNSLASSAIINEEYESLKELLVEIAPRENSSQVNHWNTGGQIYLDYIKLWEKFNDIKNGLLVPNAYQLEKMQNKVSSLCHRISQLPNKTATDRLCQSDMGTMCANFLKIIAKELVVQSDESETSYHTQSSVLAPHIEKLPLPEDCCLTELRELTSTYIDELAQL